MVDANFALPTRETLVVANYATSKKIPTSSKMETVEIDAKDAMVKNRELVSSILEHTAADCREPHGRKRHHGQSGSKSDKPEELKGI